MVPLIANTDDRVIPPAERGGWWHEYVCPVHGTELLHDGLLSGSFPDGGARCPYGCRLDTPAIRGAWTVLAHQSCAVRVRDLALGGDPADQRIVLELLVGYAEQYSALGATHDGSQGWMLRGRLFHQALTEAIWAVNIARAAWALHDQGVQLPTAVTELLAELATAAREARAILVQQGKFGSNYVAWLNAAGATCTRDEEWLTGEQGIHPHLLAATLADGWQWEASTYYHSFVLRACLLAIAGVPGAQPPVEVVIRLEQMRQVLTDLAAPSGELPAVHDGPHRRRGYDAELAELGLGVASTPLRVSAGASGLAVRQNESVTVHREGGYAILRGAGLHAVLAFGPHGGSHGHRDKLSLSLYGGDVAFQIDPGQVPYGHRHWRTYYASTAAHPTFSIDDTDQTECTGTLIGQDEVSVTVGCDTAYPGVSAVRSIRLTEDALVDEVTVRCDQPRRIALHLRPAVECDLYATGYGFATTWSQSQDPGAERLTGRHEATIAAQVRLRPGPGPADDPQRIVPHVDWVAEECREITFRSTYRVDQWDDLAGVS